VRGRTRGHARVTAASVSDGAEQRALCPPYSAVRKLWPSTPSRVRGRPSPFRGGHRIWLAAWRWQCARRLLRLSPRAGRGRFASGALAKRGKSGEGACPQAQTRGYAPSPAPGHFVPGVRCARNPTPDQVRGRLSPRTRGEVAQVALPRTSLRSSGLRAAYLRERAPFSIALVRGLVFPLFLTVSS